MSKILATVNGTPITEDEVSALIAGLGQRGASYNTPEGRKVILNQLIGDRLMLIDAKRNLLEADPAFKAELAKLKDRLLTSFAVEKVLERVSVTDKDAEEYYEANKEKFAMGETVNASHILVETEEKALDILAEIDAGKSFEDAAKEYSSCPSKENGGSLGDFGRGQMVPEFDTAVFEMQVGEVTRVPVKTQFGYHLIKLNSKNESTVAPYAEIAPQIKEMLLGEKRRAAYESKVNQLKILYPVDISL